MGCVSRKKRGPLPGMESSIHEEAYEPPNRVPETPEELRSS